MRREQPVSQLQKQTRNAKELNLSEGLPVTPANLKDALELYYISFTVLLQVFRMPGT